MAGGAAAISAALPGCIEASAMRPGRARLIIGPNGERLVEVSGHYMGRDFTLDSPFRVASITKLLVAELARRLHADGALDMDGDAGEVIGFDLRHPQFPTEVVTLRRLISHQSGIIDPPVYWLAAPGNIRTLLTPEFWEADVKPGAGFRYSNLNYGIAATVMEAATGERFDNLFTRRIAEPLGLDIGLNWSGVSREKRLSGFPCLRGRPGAWDIQVDGADMLQAMEPTILRSAGWFLRDYVPGTNGTLFSPQGGLRASVNDLAVIGQEIIGQQPALWEPTWQIPEPQSRDEYKHLAQFKGSENGHFLAFGEGVYIYPEGPYGLLAYPPDLWVGHLGEAYGFNGGLWMNKAWPTIPEMIFVHADLGSPPDDYPMSGLIPNNRVVIESAFRWAGRRW
jgi:CubicO group peptidase (beta-lactamase class C family)